MDLNHLQYFRAVAECKSVSKAAEALFITQPALSKAISKLEAELGMPLFTRGKDGMTLNINGMRLLQCANAIFSELDRCMLDFKQNSMRRIKLISNNDYGLTSEFDHIQALYPNLSISYTFDSPRACIDAVRKGSFQVALVEVRDGLYTDLERLYDELFQTAEERQESSQERIQTLPLELFHPFPEHPFQVRDDEKMEDTARSIAQFGVLVPILARPRPEGD